MTASLPPADQDRKAVLLLLLLLLLPSFSI
jgi:hypothetical protein